jgi:hypothetical protein
MVLTGIWTGHENTEGTPPWVAGVSRKKGWRKRGWWMLNGKVADECESSRKITKGHMA